jgi:hypothetical protein
MSNNVLLTAFWANTGTAFSRGTVYKKSKIYFSCANLFKKTKQNKQKMNFISNTNSRQFGSTIPL